MHIKTLRFLWFFHLLLLVALPSCLAPWHGEQDNYPVIVLQFSDSTSYDPLAIEEVGITYLEHLESSQNLPIGNAFEQENMNFDSRVDERYALLLPIDKSMGQSTFVIGNDSQKDTLVFQYKTDQKGTRQGWDVDVSWITGTSSTFGNISWCAEECPNHPRIIDYLTIVK